jgi:hypothetical protein
MSLLLNVDAALMGFLAITVFLSLLTDQHTTCLWRLIKEPYLHSGTCWYYWYVLNMAGGIEQVYMPAQFSVKMFRPIQHRLQLYYKIFPLAWAVLFLSHKTPEVLFHFIYPTWVWWFSLYFSVILYNVPKIVNLETNHTSFFHVFYKPIHNSRFGLLPNRMLVFHINKNLKLQ